MEHAALEYDDRRRAKCKQAQKHVTSTLDRSLQRISRIGRSQENAWRPMAWATKRTWEKQPFPATRNWPKVKFMCNEAQARAVAFSRMFLSFSAQIPLTTARASPVPE